jgi:hypothetical protein
MIDKALLSSGAELHPTTTEQKFLQSAVLVTESAVEKESSRVEDTENVLLRVDAYASQLLVLTLPTNLSC